jgi:hypothetical protein
LLTMYVILEDGGFIDRWKITIHGVSILSPSPLHWNVAYPLVNTFNKLVFPQAPSPLSYSVSSRHPMDAPLARDAAGTCNRARAAKERAGMNVQ